MAQGLAVRSAEDASLSAILPQLEDVAVVCWLAPIDDPGLRSLLERLVDTPVRGFVYESPGAVPEAIREAQRRRIPIELVDRDAGRGGWLAAVARLLSPG